MNAFNERPVFNTRRALSSAPFTFLAIIFAVLVVAVTWTREIRAEGTWSESGSLNTARINHAAALVPGNRVLVAGGMDAEWAIGLLATAELFDSQRGRWRTVGSMGTPRWQHTATALFDGRVLVTGGDGEFGAQFSAEIFTPVTDTWSYTGSMTYPRYQHTATLLADGRVLAAGGISVGNNALNNAEIYDPDTGLWSSAGVFNDARNSHTATLLADGRVLVTGGEDLAVTLCLNSAVIYDPATNTWADTNPLAHCRRSHTATLLPDGRVLIVGGLSSTAARSTVEIFDPVAGTWSSADSLTYARFGHTSTLLADGRVMVMGGIGTAESPINKVEIYDPDKGAWTTVGPPNDARSYHTATLLDDGRVVVAGNGLTGPPLYSVTIFDPLNFVTNGSFETGVLDPGDGWIRLASGSTTIFRWNVVGDGGVDYRGDWQAAEAELCVDLNSTSPGTMAQVLATPRRGRYLLTFSMAGHTGGLPVEKTLRVYAGERFQDFTFDTAGKDIGNMGWTTKRWFFNADISLTVLKFQSLTTGSYGPAIDNIRVIRIKPDPLIPMLFLLN